MRNDRAVSIQVCNAMLDHIQRTKQAYWVVTALLFGATIVSMATLNPVAMTAAVLSLAGAYWMVIHLEQIYHHERIWRAWLARTVDPADQANPYPPEYWEKRYRRRAYRRSRAK